MAFILPFLLDEDTSTEPADGNVRPRSIPSRRRVPGLAGFGDPDATPPIRVRGIPSRRRATGPQPEPGPLDTRPLRPLPISRRRRVPGPFLPPAEVTDPPPGGPAPGALVVVGYPDANPAQAHPRMNDKGTGSFTTLPPGPDVDDVIGFDVAGRRIFTGLAGERTHTLRASGEESAQTVAVTVPGLLAEFDEALVLPDFGARDPGLLGSPVQDVRYFDWRMVGLGNVSFGGAPLDLVPSTSIDMTDAALAGTYPIPDVWPDPWARWMWVSDPRNNAPRGWCHFRVDTGTGNKPAHLYATAYDYAEVWVDGVPMLTCDTPGVTQRVDIEATGHSHLVTIRAYNASGRAAVLFTMLPVEDSGLYGPALMNSRSNWRCLAYTRRSFVSTPGQVLLRLRLEAQDRGLAAGRWGFTFTGTRDSAGRPWPSGLDPFAADVGMTYTDVLNRLAEDRIDYVAAPAGRILHAYVKDQGTGVTRALPWTEAVDMTSRSRKIAAR